MSGATGRGGGRVVDLAGAFAATLTADQLADLVLEHTFANAANWSNLPDGYLSCGRLGLRTGRLDGAQWAALEALLTAATGSRSGAGADALRSHLAADDWLRDHGGGDFYGRGNFFVAFLGTPSETGAWQLQFGGHHLALANSYRDGVLVGATPSFRGIEPFGGSGSERGRVDPMRRRHESLARLLGSLDPGRLAAAELSGSYPDVILGPGRDLAFPERPEGIAAAELGPEGRALLLDAIGSFVADVEDEAAAGILASYERELDSTHLGFAGSPELREAGDYVRIDGESVWIEYSMHPGGVLPHPHPHSLWRDRRSDYGGPAIRSAVGGDHAPVHGPVADHAGVVGAV